MCDDEKDKSKDNGEKQSSKKDKDNDPRLDFFSEQFDPLYALSVERINVPIPHARTYDNLHAYQSAQQKQSDPTAPSKQAHEVKTKAEDAETSAGKRRFLPHQMPISKPRKQLANIFTRMEKMEGPLNLLKKCIDEKLKIKVWTRNASSIRGYCTAYVTAFDKHWNLALSDVSEVWTRPKKRKTLLLDADVDNSFKTKRSVKPPPIKILKVTKKQEVCSRQVDQYILRGEHIVLISIPTDDRSCEKKVI